VPVTGASVLQLGAVTGTLDWQAAPDGGTQTLPLPGTAGVAAGRHEGSGRPWLTLQTLAAVPLRAPLAAGYRITRSVGAVQRKSPEAWSRGDIQRVRLEIEALGDMAWVVVSDPVPTGATLLAAGWVVTRRWRRGVNSARAAPGRRTWNVRRCLARLLRMAAARAACGRVHAAADASGHFGLPPTRVEAMYAPETFGEVPNAALEVLP